ncbi:hypothetical protein ACFQZ8_28820, partial [Micromonospora azadirachtae]
MSAHARRRRRAWGDAGRVGHVPRPTAGAGLPPARPDAAGLVAAGDPTASFIAVYGQGMTSAMLHARRLWAYLCSGRASRP